ncbi:MAG: flavodoxin [Clostridia bacterium]|mgnify:CR=1 FL=1|nr:flavodoxin [Clostridia bacterium]
MKNTLILYHSKYGATKKYAGWLAESLSCDVMEIKKAKIEQIKKYHTVIFGGGIYSSKIAGISFLKKHIEHLKNKTIIIFAVGAFQYNRKAVEELKLNNIGEELKHIPCFYCRGAWNEDTLSLKDRILCRLLEKIVTIKKPSARQPWEIGFMEAVGSNHDWTDIKYAYKIIEYLHKEIGNHTD